MEGTQQGAAGGVGLEALKGHQSWTPSNLGILCGPEQWAQDKLGGAEKMTGSAFHVPRLGNTFS